MADFLESIPARLRTTIHTANTDMWEGYVNALDEFAQTHDEVSLEIVIDRFHVAQNYRDKFDNLRKKELKRLKKELPKADYEADCKGTLWLLRKNHRDLDDEERRRLKHLFRWTPKLKQAYTLREELTAIFEMPLNQVEGKERLLKWSQKVQRRGVTCFNSFLTSLERHITLIANYFTYRASSGFVEGLNNKIKVIKRRCYGIRKAETLFQRIWLDLKGVAYFV